MCVYVCVRGDAIQATNAIFFGGGVGGGVERAGQGVFFTPLPPCLGGGWKGGGLGRVGGGGGLGQWEEPKPTPPLPPLFFVSKFFKEDEAREMLKC